MGCWLATIILLWVLCAKTKDVSPNERNRERCVWHRGCNSRSFSKPRRDIIHVFFPELFNLDEILLEVEVPTRGLVTVKPLTKRATDCTLMNA